MKTLSSNTTIMALVAWFLSLMLMIIHASNCQIADQCDFDTSFCDWQVGSNAPEQLRRCKRSEWTNDISPTKDHTNKSTGDYLVYLNTSDVRPGAYGYLTSRTMQRSWANKCTLQWFYYMQVMYGYGIGKLSIIYKDLETQSERLLWQATGNQGNVWKFENVTFDITSFLYKIIIKAERGVYFRSDVAIDDVSFAPNCLQTEEFEPITIVKYGHCNSVKHSVKSSSASLYQFGNGGWYCFVEIRTDFRLRINIYAEFLNTDSSKEVVIMAGGNMSASYGGNFSGSVEPFSLISSTNVIRIELPLLRGIGSHSFTFNITSTDQPGHPPVYYKPSGSKRIDAIRDCGSDIARLKVSSYAYITPRVLNGNYYNNERCIFKFVASNGYRVKVIFDEFDTEFKYDYIEILDNGIIGQSRFTGSLGRVQFVSKRSLVEILFVTDASVRRSGFRLFAIATSEQASIARSYDYIVRSTPRWVTTNTDSWLTTTPYQLPTTAPWFSFEEDCIHRQQSQFARNSIFRELYFDSAQDNNFGSGLCTWEGFGPRHSHHFLEFRYINTGSWRNVLRLSYGAGKSKEFRGHVNITDLDLFETGNYFKITMSFYDYLSSKIHIVFSATPGCYKSSLGLHYVHKYKVLFECECTGFKYRFLDDDDYCYCGNHPPAYYGFFLQHPNFCSNCTGSCGYGKLFLEPRQWRSGPRAPDDNKTAKMTVTLTASLSVFLLMIIGSAVLLFCTKKARASKRIKEGITAPRNQVSECPGSWLKHPMKALIDVPTSDSERKTHAEGWKNELQLKKPSEEPESRLEDCNRARASSPIQIVGSGPCDNRGANMPM